MGDFLSYHLCPVMPGVVALHGSLNHQAKELFVAYLDCIVLSMIIILTVVSVFSLLSYILLLLVREIVLVLLIYSW